MNQTILITILLLIIINGYGFVYSYLITGKSFRKNKKIQNKTNGLNVLIDRTPLVLFNISILMILNSIGLYFFKDYYIKDYSSVLITLGEVLFVLTIDDIFFYVLHRTMHENKFIYKKIHKIHHRANVPIPIEYIYVHPLEWMSGMIGPFLGMIIIGKISFIAYIFYLIIRNFHEIHIHSGIKTSLIHKLFPLYGTNEHHDMHHAKRDGNYSSTFTFWDIVFKTKI